MAKTISDQTREYFCYIKQKVRKGEKVIPWLSGTKRKRTMMYKETSRYEKDGNRHSDDGKPKGIGQRYRGKHGSGRTCYKVRGWSTGFS